MSGSSARPNHRERVMSDKIDPSDAPQKTATQARAGATGHNVRYVLVVGLGAAIVALGIVLVTFFSA
jgi:hypothetical protein